MLPSTATPSAVPIRKKALLIAEPTPRRSTGSPAMMEFSAAGITRPAPTAINTSPWRSAA
ncbi:MAG: hypothetical protein R2722_13300 [Tessaracoccus sp.]